MSGFGEGPCVRCGAETRAGFAHGTDPLCPSCWAEGLGVSPAWAGGHREATELASESDRAYFEAHPDEQVRTRPEFVGEFPPSPVPDDAKALVALGGELHHLVEVTRVAPGLRSRRPFLFVAFGGGS